MKNNKGFTLVEIIATIGVLLLIATVSVPSIISINKKNKEKNYTKLIEVIETAAENYYMFNNFDTSSNSTCYITLSDLVNKGLIKAPIINPNTNKEISLDNIVKIKNIISNDVLTTKYEYTNTVQNEEELEKCEIKEYKYVKNQTFEKNNSELFSAVVGNYLITANHEDSGESCSGPSYDDSDPATCETYNDYVIYIHDMFTGNLYWSNSLACTLEYGEAIYSNYTLDQKNKKIIADIDCPDFGATSQEHRVEIPVNLPHGEIYQEITNTLMLDELGYETEQICDEGDTECMKNFVNSYVNNGNKIDDTATFYTNKLLKYNSEYGFMYNYNDTLNVLWLQKR